VGWLVVAGRPRRPRRHGHTHPRTSISIKHPNTLLLHHSNDQNHAAMITLTYLEFYSGIGGWGYALEHALRNVAVTPPSQPEQPQLHCQLLGAFDHSDICKHVFVHNHHQGTNHNQNKKLFRQTPIERITLEELETHSAHIWCMSPPCQPHTRQHSNQQIEMNDPRSKSFLHLCDMIGTMEQSTLPCLILLENVIGFELSGTTVDGDDTQTQSTNDSETNQLQQMRRGSFQTWREVLSKREYQVAHFHISPEDIGLPNARPRHYTVAFRPGSLHSKIKDTTISAQVTSLCNYGNLFAKEILHEPPVIWGPKSLGTIPPELPLIGDFLDVECELEPLRIPEKVWSSSSAWCFDVVTPLHHRSACFTHSYAKFVRGTGSILYTGPMSNDSDEIGNTNRKRDREGKFLVATRFDLEAPEARTFDADWSNDIDWKNDMRYFSGTEIARLMGFPVSKPAVRNRAAHDGIDTAFRKFSFPSTISVKQQWKLLGNSLNVQVAGTLAEIGIKTLLCSDLLKN